MKLIDTPNPNAKKIETKLTSSTTNTSMEQEELLNELENIDGVSSVFLGPGFITITKSENIDWDAINQDIVDIFDKL
ncbi:NifU N-terminal domain-containing protein [Acidimicrobiaceae bacterium]|nr:NifU N-terminal domain-containing protein [Acidimicrobiaceae bacterium]|tara:strand:+ start:494 stop:724 length:231 start_codon:yes stop_codon:yes gene_type:complete